MTVVINFSEKERQEIVSAANRINNLKMGQRLGIVVNLLVQNAALLREVNQHRAEKGTEPWQSYEFKAAQ